MNPSSVFPAIAALLLTYITSFLLVKKFGAPNTQGRFACVDGLRGYLAICVFLHHSCVWYFYIQTGRWELPASNLYIHFGQSAVALFFMITGFLFFTKIISSKTRAIDWCQLFVSRILRLAPLYFLVVILLCVVVAVLTNGVLTVPLSKLGRDLIGWLSFTMLGAPDLNGLNRTGIIVAGVTWSLPYEWFFYLTLPLMALTVGTRPPILYLFISVISIFYFSIWHPSIHYLAFLAGIVTAFLVRSSSFCNFAASRSATFVALGCLCCVVAFFPSTYGLAPLGLLAVFFALVASGNSLFGLLLSPASRTLGELAYGIYLLHGITLFVLFNFVIGLSVAKNMSVVQYWGLILSVTPIIVLFCFAVFRWFEEPFMRQTPALSRWLRVRLKLSFL